MGRELPGADFIEVKPPQPCKHCTAEVFRALVRNPHNKTLKWHNFERQPIERDGRRFYLPHKHAR